MNQRRQTRAEWVEAALQRFEAPLIRYATGIVGDEQRARDVVQETFLKLCQAKREGLDDRLAAWLYTVCRNRALDVRKKEGRMGTLDNVDTVANGDDSPHQLAARSQAHRRVLVAVGQLPPDQREAFRLKFADQLTYREIGRVMGKSLGTVSNLITAALATVREQTADAGGVR